jgi:hypothetical protein
VAPTTTTALAGPCKPGWGRGDKNHCHTGPPGQLKKAANVEDGNGGGGAFVVVAIALGLLAIARPRRRTT